MHDYLCRRVGINVRDFGRKEICVMKKLSSGASGPEVERLQLALCRAGYGPLKIDGVFGRGTRCALSAFQLDRRMAGDGAVGPETASALRPWLRGCIEYNVRRGDTPYAVALRYGVGLRALETANPAMDPTQLRAGEKLTVPLPFSVVPAGVSFDSALVADCVRGLALRYPFLDVRSFGRSVMGRALWELELGRGPRMVAYSAAHHANEWITAPLLLKFAEELCEAAASGGSIRGIKAEEILSSARLCIVPAVNPDGIDLVTGALAEGEYYSAAERVAAEFPDIPFPSGWKANIAGTDLNLQYPAGWERAKEIKYALGYDRPAPRDFVGPAPLSAPESRALCSLTRSLSPDMVIALHTQGEVIYWRYQGMEPPDARHYAECFAAASGYALDDAPDESGFAGYKDWFIAEFARPGYTVECGLGENPLPVSDFEEMYRRVRGILVLAAAGC